MKGQVAVFCSLITKFFGEGRCVATVEERVKEKVQSFTVGCLRKLKGTDSLPGRASGRWQNPSEERHGGSPALRQAPFPQVGHGNKSGGPPGRGIMSVSVLTFSCHG